MSIASSIVGSLSVCLAAKYVCQRASTVMADAAGRPPVFHTGALYCKLCAYLALFGS
jgi:hypothetical protein